jgi:hypothetical protein
MKLCVLATAAGLAIGASSAAAETTTFDAMTVGATPSGFSVALTGAGGVAIWTVRPAPDGAAGHVVVQSSAEAIDARFPLLVDGTVAAEDVDLSVRFRPVSGNIDRAAGLVWRYRDANNYYLVRANALEDNVVAYKVENGRRVDLPVKGQGQTYGVAASVAKTGWSTLGVSARGKLFSVSLNGKVLYEVEDGTFAEAGKIGLWTKADSVMMFDDFTWTVAK